MRVCKILMIAATTMATLTVTAAGPAQAHLPAQPGWLNGTGVTNTQGPGHTLDISAGFLNGSGSGSLILDAVPMVVLCLNVVTDFGGSHNYLLNAVSLLGGSPVYIDIWDASFGDSFGVGPQNPNSPCDAKMPTYPLATGSPVFTTL